MKAYLHRRYSFSAAHRLHNEALSDDENQRLYGKCNNRYGHGHNYVLEVTVSGEVDPRTGMICDLSELDAAVEREVMARFDHENLNMVPEFSGKVPTSEALIQVIFDKLQGSFAAARLERVRLEETSQNSFEYAGGNGLPR